MKSSLMNQISTQSANANLSLEGVTNMVTDLEQSGTIVKTGNWSPVVLVKQNADRQRSDLIRTGHDLLNLCKFCYNMAKCI